MSSDAKIADIKRQLGEAVNRIENIQSGGKQPLLTRVSNHFKTQSGSIVNVVLTASLFIVAIGRLQQKQQHEVISRPSAHVVSQSAQQLSTTLVRCLQSDRQDWQEEQRKLDLDRQRYFSPNSKHST